MACYNAAWRGALPDLTTGAALAAYTTTGQYVMSRSAANQRNNQKQHPHPATWSQVLLPTFT